MSTIQAVVPSFSKYPRKFQIPNHDRNDYRTGSPFSKGYPKAIRESQLSDLQFRIDTAIREDLMQQEFDLLLEDSSFEID